ncbi:MAG: PsbP-related protein [Patescibacteria group bacterium]|jgi:hypothetical protein
MDKDKSAQIEEMTSPSNNTGSSFPKWTLVLLMIGAIVALMMISAVMGFVVSKNLVPNSEIPQVTTEPSPTSELKKTVTWETYTNTKYGYSIDYPSNWMFRESPDSKNGAAFNPTDKPGYPDKSDSISIYAGQIVGSSTNVTFEEYVKTAASQEIQNYGKLVSLKKVTTTEGVAGYETTWTVQAMAGTGSGPSTSLPITYFELPGNKTMLVRVTLDREEDLEVYEKMLSTVKFTSVPSISPPSPTIDEKVLLQTTIKAQLATKFNSDGSNLTVTVSQIDGTSAKGMVSDGSGGGIWFAAKTNSEWKLVWDGNGVIQCTDLTQYPDFSTTLVPECWDTTSQGLVKR